MSVRHLMAWPCSAPFGLLRVAHFPLEELPLSLHVFLTEFILFGPSLLLAIFFSGSVFLRLWVLGHGEFPPFCLQPRVFESFCHFPQFSGVGVVHFEPSLWTWLSGLLTLLLCCCPRTSISLHLHFISGVLVCPPLLPWNLVVCGACMLPWWRFVLVYSWPLCAYGQCGNFLSVWLGPLAGHTPGGFPFLGPAPSLGVWLAVPRLCFSRHSPCAWSVCGGRVFSLGVYASPGLLALQGLGVLPFSFFSGLFCFVFSLSRFLGFAVPLWWCLPGCSFPPWPSFLGRHFCL